MITVMELNILYMYDSGMIPAVKLSSTCRFSIAISIRKTLKKCVDSYEYEYFASGGK